MVDDWRQFFYFYPRPPRGGRRCQGLAAAHLKKISIHALREEGDFLSGSCFPSLGNFYPRPPRGGRLDTKEAYKQILEFLSTPSARRATDGDGFAWALQDISIHALREEGDEAMALVLSGEYISIHALREEGDSKNRDKISIFKQIIQHSARI